MNAKIATLEIERPPVERNSPCPADCAPAPIITAALARLADDPGAIFERMVLDAIRSARGNDPASYQRIRAQAKAAKANISELDRLTLPARDAGEEDAFPDVTPWPQPVNGAALLADIRNILARHVVADAPTLTAAMLWAVHSWCMEVLTVSPLAHITAPEKRCGKTILLTALGRLAFRPMQTSNISPSALFRAVERWQPTLLIDEADSFLRDNEEARGLINSGLYRESAFVLRCVGDDFTPTRFATWGAKAVCGIGRLADTIEDRSIPLRLRRKTEGDRVENIRRSEPGLWEALQARIARWTTDNLHRIGAANPDPAIGLNDRAQDCWEPLLAIADLAGGDWPATARAAAIALHGVEDEAPGIGTELLSDIRDVFEAKRTSRLSSRELLGALVADEETPWATWNRGKPMTARQLAARLKDFRITPTTTRLPNGDRLKGYTRESCAQAFAAYLSPGEGGFIRDNVTSEHSCGFPGFPIRDITDRVTGVVTAESKAVRHCHAVTDKNGGEKGKGDFEGEIP